MVVKVIDLRCSGCGGALATSEHFCKFCGNAVVASSFNSIYTATAQDAMKLARSLDKDLAENSNGDVISQISTTQAFCYLKLRRYDEALSKFKAAIENNFDNPESHFYAAVCLLRGKKAFLVPLADIKLAMEYINSAQLIEDRGVFNYFLAYIKLDFHARRSLRASPDWRGELAAAHSAAPPVLPTDAEILFTTLGVERPPELVF
jgi:tetratricopeptide (TPR) repeat protein